MIINYSGYYFFFNFSNFICFIFEDITLTFLCLHSTSVFELSNVFFETTNVLFVTNLVVISHFTMLLRSLCLFACIKVEIIHYYLKFIIICTIWTRSVQWLDPGRRALALENREIGSRTLVILHLISHEYWNDIILQRLLKPKLVF